MAKYRNITDRTLWVQADPAGGIVKCEPDEMVTAPDTDSRYWQTGEQGEDAIWERVDAPKGSKKVVAPAPADDDTTNQPTEG